jgi:hypothetical protein
MLRNTLSLLAMVLLVATHAVAAQSDLTGDWNVTVQAPQGPASIRVSIKQTGDKLDGRLKSPMGEIPFDGTISGDDLQLTFPYLLQGQAVTIAMTGKVVDGSTVTGKAKFGPLGDGDWKATRIEADSNAAAASPESALPPASASAGPASASAGSAPSSFSGVWDLVIKTGMTEFPLTAMLSVNGDNVSGTISSQLGSLPVTGTVLGKLITMTMIAKTPQGDFPIKLTGELDGDAIVNGKGELAGMGQGEWSAKRSKQ